MWWLTFVSEIDMGRPFTGVYWAITNIPAKHNQDNMHMPLPPTSATIIAMELIDVIQIQLPEPGECRPFRFTSCHRGRFAFPS
jgi:hypothetical protein